MKIKIEVKYCLTEKSKHGELTRLNVEFQDLSYKDKHWHEACFFCTKCKVSLVDKQFGSKVDKIYCSNCYDAQFATRCDACGDIFRAGMSFLTLLRQYSSRQKVTLKCCGTWVTSFKCKHASWFICVWRRYCSSL